MAGKIEFNIHPFYTNKIKSAYTFDRSLDTAGQGAPGILIDIDSIVSIGSEVRSVSLPDITGDPGEQTQLKFKTLLSLFYQQKQ